MNHTLSRSKGKFEGQVHSDIDQADVAATAAFDFPELMDNADGPLANNHTHVVKAFGYYQLTPEWNVGTKVNIVSGGPKSCIGNLPKALNVNNNPGGWHVSATCYCDEKPAPRGSFGRLPTDLRVALNATDMPQLVKGLSLCKDKVSAYYGQVLGRAPERQVRFSAEYNYKF
jgi:hypothetical protein